MNKKQKDSRNMQVFRILKSFETQPIEGNKIEDILQKQDILLITDDDAHIIYIYWREKSAILLKFIAKKIAMIIANHTDNSYSIQEITDKTISEQIRQTNISIEGNIPQIIRKDLLDQNNKFSQVNTKKKKEIEIKPFEWTDKQNITDLEVFKIQRAADIIKEVKDLPKIEGFRPDLILIGNVIYTPTIELKKFLERRELEEKIVKLGPIPTGKFFLSGYSTRMIIHNNQIQAIEFLRKTDERSPIAQVNAPLLYSNRIMSERNSEDLIKAYKIPPEESMTEILNKIQNKNIGKK